MCGEKKNKKIGLLMWQLIHGTLPNHCSLQITASLAVQSQPLRTAATAGEDLPQCWGGKKRAADATLSTYRWAALLLSRISTVAKTTLNFKAWRLLVRFQRRKKPKQTKKAPQNKQTNRPKQQHKTNNAPPNKQTNPKQTKTRSIWKRLASERWRKRKEKKSLISNLT